MTPGVAIVTGSRRGIGRQIAYSLARRGFDLVVSDIEDGPEGAETVECIRRLGRAATFQHCDVVAPEQHGELIETARRLGTPSVLVNNAGVSSLVRGDLLDLSMESLDRSINVNFRGTFLLTQAFAKHLTAHPAPDLFRAIVTITSVNATILGLNRADYCMTKAALSMMTRLFAARLAADGINVYEVRPGMTLTDMVAPSRAAYDGMIADGLVPMRRWGQPEDVGEAVANLATGSFRFSTGDAVHVDGGLNLYRV
jgi:NAD(P)-dependent dehydrogenase (short-subunit alcohol dehydrogenase family)